MENNNNLENEQKEQHEKQETVENKDTGYNELEERKKELKERLKYGMRDNKDPKEEKKNKSSKNSRKSGNNGKKFNFKTIILLLFIITIIMSVPALMDNAKEKEQKTISYSQFLKATTKGNFFDITEKEGYVIGETGTKEELASKGQMILTAKMDKDYTEKEYTQFLASKGFTKSNPLYANLKDNIRDHQSGEEDTILVELGTEAKYTAIGYTENNIKYGQKYRARMISNRISQDPKLLAAVSNATIDIKSEDPPKTPLIVQILISWFPMLLLVGVWFFMMNKMKGGGSGGGPSVFNMGKSKAKDNGENVSNVKFGDVAGIEEAKQELIEVVDFLKNPEKYKKIGATIPKGVLLLGSPGTGKTLLAKAVAGEAAVPFFSISGSEFVEMFVGVGASRVRDLFNKARKASPCIIFIDEIDAVGRKRGSGQGGGNDEREQTLNQLLVEMDGFGTEETIIVIAATNRAEILDKALMRPGRFDRQVVVDKPDIKGREAILNVHIKGKKISKDVDLHILAKKTPGFVGADLANLLNEAAILAARQKRDIILMEDLEEASEKVSIGPARKSRVTVEKEKLIVAYHEVGHAMIQNYYKDIVDPVHKVTIIPRGMAALGYTMSLPTEDRYLRSKKEYLADIRGLLGGRAAEQVVFDDITTGASNDIERVTGIAHAMVTKLGMTDRFGPMLLDATKEGDMFQNKIYGEETAKAIDEEIKKIVNEAYTEVLATLRENYDILEKTTKALLERETITGDELNILMAGGELEPLKPAEPAKAKELEEIKEELISEGKIISDDVAKTVENLKQED